MNLAATSKYHVASISMANRLRLWVSHLKTQFCDCNRNLHQLSSTTSCDLQERDTVHILHLIVLRNQIVTVQQLVPVPPLMFDDCWATRLPLQQTKLWSWSCHQHDPRPKKMESLAPSRRGESSRLNFEPPTNDQWDDYAIT